MSVAGDVRLKPYLKSLTIYFVTALRIGTRNVVRVVIYRVLKRVGYYRWRLPVHDSAMLGLDLASIPMPSRPTIVDLSAVTEATRLLAGTTDYFSWHPRTVSNPPNWFLNPFLNVKHPQSSTHWSRIPDFASHVGDIKVIWELSRFMWAPLFVRSWRLSGDHRFLMAFQQWIEDWWQSNPPNTGPNWKCGQETSIRLINTLLALHLAGAERNAVRALVPFVEAHCRRIALTMFYAIGQDNNHGTSEAAGLFIGGGWLARNADGNSQRQGRKWREEGRKLLQGLVDHLVLEDGTFSQHSLTYHRMMLDTLSLAEAFRHQYNESPFRSAFYSKTCAAVRWFGAMIELSSGDGPNLGGNDGTLPYRLGPADYRDFRPSLQLSSVVFLGSRALACGPWDEPLLWLGLRGKLLEKPWLLDRASHVFEKGGYIILCSESNADGRVLVRAPTARFRPNQSDSLHIDLWWKGENILRDGGTYSYAQREGIALTLASVAGHNTVQFDDHDQMPRLGRFLYGAWTKVAGSHVVIKNADGQSWAGGYSDEWGGSHKRIVTLKANTLSVTDHVHGFRRRAVLRWRMISGDWSLNETGCTSSHATIRVESGASILRMSLENGWESRHYLESSATPVLEVEIGEAPAVLTTIITLP